MFLLDIFFACELPSRYRQCTDATPPCGPPAVLMQSEPPAARHRVVALAVMECHVRYGRLLQQQPQCIHPVLRTFLGDTGMGHPCEVSQPLHLQALFRAPVVRHGGGAVNVQAHPPAGSAVLAAFIKSAKSLQFAAPCCTASRRMVFPIHGKWADPHLWWQAVSTRACYLFCRLVKVLRQNLRQLLPDILQSLSPHLLRIATQ